MEQKTHKLIVNVEGQKKFEPGYDIVTRGIFYCARMLSAQKDTEFIGSDYDAIKKVYSIWISMENPLHVQHTITSYRISEHPLYGMLPVQKRFDLMELVFVCLGTPKAKNKGNELHGLLNTLLSPDLLPEEKEKIIYKDYGIETTAELEGGLREMCNLSDLIEEKGIEKGIERGIEKGREEGKLDILIALVRDGLLSVEEAAKRVEMTVDDMLKLVTT